MEKVRFAIVGCGRIAPKHAEAINSLEFAELVAVCDIKKDRADLFARKYKANVHYSFEEMLEQEDCHVVNICTPSGCHASMGILAAQKKKHVLVEKPMAMNLDEADSLIEACLMNNVLLGVVHQNRYNKAVKMVRQALDQGMFGSLTHVNAAVRWNRNDDYYKQADWRGTWKMDGGCLMNQAIHNIDLLQWMLGPLETVSAYASTMVRKIEAPDIGVAVVRAKNGAFGIIEAANTIYPRNLEETLHVFGEKGTAAIGGIAVNKLTAWRFREDYHEEEAAVLKQQELDPPDVYGLGHRELIQDFIEAVCGKKIFPISGEEGRKALELVLAMFKSSDTGLPVRLPLETLYRPGGLK